MDLPKDDEYITPTAEDIINYIKKYPRTLNDDFIIKTLIWAIENDIKKEDDINRKKIKEELHIKRRILKFDY